MEVRGRGVALILPTNKPSDAQDGIMVDNKVPSFFLITRIPFIYIIYIYKLYMIVYKLILPFVGRRAQVEARTDGAISKSSTNQE